MPRHVHFVLALLGSCAIAGCSVMAHDAAVPMVRARFTEEYDCPDKKLDVEPMVGQRYRVTGCGKRATYNTQCVALQCAVAEDGKEAQGFRDRPTLDEMGGAP